MVSEKLCDGCDAGPWRFCPHCGAPLMAPVMTRRHPTLEELVDLGGVKRLSFSRIAQLFGYRDPVAVRMVVMGAMGRWMRKSEQEYARRYMARGGAAPPQEHLFGSGTDAFIRYLDEAETYRHVTGADALYPSLRDREWLIRLAAKDLPGPFPAGV